MKYLFIFIGSILILSTNVLLAQSNNTNEVNKKQILERMEQWGQQVIIDGQLDAIKKFFPNSGKTLSIENQKIKEWTNEQIVKEFSSQLENIKYTSYHILPDPYIFVTEDGNTAFVYATHEIEYKNLKTNKEDKFSLIELEILIKEDGKWVAILDIEEPPKEERKIVTVDKKILNEYNGTYKSETSENIYTVTNDGKNLIFITKEGNQIILKPQSEYSFFMEGQLLSIIFGRDTKGKVSFYTFIQNNVCSVADKID